MTPRKRAVLIVDPQPALRIGLKRLLSEELELDDVSEARGPTEAKEIFSESCFDLVITELFFQGGEGLELIRTLNDQRPKTVILVFSSLDESIYAERSLRAGASGFVRKEAPAAELFQAIRRVLEGHTCFSPYVVQNLFARLASNDKHPGNSPIAGLTGRELRVFELLGQGFETREIARRLDISPKTVSTYYDHIKTKLDLPSKTSLIRRAVLWLSEEKRA